MDSSFRIIDPFIRQPTIIELERLPEEMKILVKDITQIEDQEGAVKYAYKALSKRYRLPYFNLSTSRPLFHHQHLFPLGKNRILAL